MTMLRLLLLTLLLTVKADKPYYDGSGGEYNTDDEEQEEVPETFKDSGIAANVKNAKPDDADPEDGNTMVIIIAAVCVVALAIVTVIAVVLFKLHLQRREQGVYSVPVEQGQKGV